MTSTRRAIELSAACLLIAAPALLHAQGILTLTPARLAATAAGTGTPGYSAGSTPATSAPLFNPAGAVFDTAGNLFFADSRNNVVRMVSASTGNITTVAGNGAQGYTGDGGSATTASLDTPMGLALDSSNNLYIADSHNHAIRMVSGNTISTVAGTGVSGFSGDGSAATSATLDLPQGVAVDSTGTLYIADTGNQRIRKVTGNTISTIAGTGLEAESGDGGPASTASLDMPSGLALDQSGNLFIADSHNHVIREISGTTISTVAGTGVGGFSGDGGAATSATLFLPQAVAVDANGSLYVADSSNNRIRQVASGSIATIAGNGTESFAGDGLAATSASLDTPRGVAPDATGNLAIADTLNQRIRAVPLTALAFGSEPVGKTSSTLTLVLGNSGSSQLQVTSLTLPSQFILAGGTCSAPPITIAPSSGCSLSLAFAPTMAAPASGTVTFSGAGLIPHAILVTGTGTFGTPTIAFSVPAKKHDFDPPFQVAASSNSSGAVTYSVSSGPATIFGSIVTLTGAPGSVVLEANEAADSNYLMDSAQATITVTKGTVWTSDAGSGLSALDLTGIPYASSAYTGGGLAGTSGPQTIAVDGPGFQWVAASGSTGIGKIDGDGNPAQGSPFTGGGVSNPAALAVDGNGSIWIANSGGSVSALANTGTPISPGTGYVKGTSLSGLTIDPSGNVWISSPASNAVVELLGAAAPTTPLAAAVANGSLGERP